MSDKTPLALIARNPHLLGSPFINSQGMKQGRRCWRLKHLSQTEEKPCKSGVWSDVWRGKFATSFETLADLISEGLLKANKNKKVETAETAEQDKTIPPSNTRNSKFAAVGRMSLLQKF